MEKKLKIGVFGTWRGLEYIKAIQILDNAEVTAICDKDPSKIEEAKKFCKPDVKVCADFEELIHSGIEAVVLTNFFHQHAPFAIRAMKAGLHVLSECQSAVTMKECVELVETKEATGMKFALAENYPFFRCNMEMEKIYKSGQIGEVIFAEGEYVHPMSKAENDYYNPDPTHWRSLTPCTYYCTHALAPLMKITDLMPKRVIGKVAAGYAYAEDLDIKGADCYGVLMLEMSNGSVFRVGGSGAFGPKGNWYRLGCSRGGVEGVRGNTRQVRLVVNPWSLTDENRMYGTECIYTPEVTADGKKAINFEHDGADYWVTKTFVDDVLNDREPYMDVYRGAALAAVGILGWESATSDSKQFDVPDFRKKEDRDKYRDDDKTPYVIDGKPATLPAGIHFR